MICAKKTSNDGKKDNIINNNQKYIINQKKEETEFKSEKIEEYINKILEKKIWNEILKKEINIFNEIEKVHIKKIINPNFIEKKIKDQLKEKTTKSELIETIINQIFYSIKYYELRKLISVIYVEELYKKIPNKFSESMYILRNKKTEKLREDIYNFIKQNETELNSIIIKDNDYKFDISSLKFMEKMKYIKQNDKNEIIETPNYMFLRIAVGIWATSKKIVSQDIDYEKTIMKKIKECYKHLSDKNIMFATPTITNSAMDKNQYSSCFLFPVDDSLEGIYKDAVWNVAKISGSGGGIGMNITEIRAAGSTISSSGGRSTGLVSKLKVFDQMSRDVNQSGFRKASIAVYIDPSHIEIEKFLELKDINNNEEYRTRDLFPALWIPNIFMERVINNDKWTLFTYKIHQELNNLDNKEYESKYEYYEKTAKSDEKKEIKAVVLFNKIIKSCLTTGTPYIMYKDSSNYKSNQKNLGTIKSSNLCCEIIEYSDKDNIAVCNLGSINLENLYCQKCYLNININKLEKIIDILVQNLNQIIDITTYPLLAAKSNNQKYRPIGLGVQGLSDLFIKMKIGYASEEAKKVNKYIFEAIYYYALKSSLELVKSKKYKYYENFFDSPLGSGNFHFNLCNDYHKNHYNNIYEKYNENESKFNWIKLRKEIKESGIVNSLLIALMPTVSSSKIFNKTESFEPLQNIIYSTKTITGEYINIHPELVKTLIEYNLWNNKTINDLKKYSLSDGSLRNIEYIPNEIKEVYQTIWDIKMKDYIDMCEARQKFIDQSQSMNTYFQYDSYNIDLSKITSAFIYAYKKGLKTGSYYTRTFNKINAMAITIEEDEYYNEKKK